MLSEKLKLVIPQSRLAAARDSEYIDALKRVTNPLENIVILALVAGIRGDTVSWNSLLLPARDNDNEYFIIVNEGRAEVIAWKLKNGEHPSEEELRRAITILRVIRPPIRDPSSNEKYYFPLVDYNGEPYLVVIKNNLGEFTFHHAQVDKEHFVETSAKLCAFKTPIISEDACLNKLEYSAIIKYSEYYSDDRYPITRDYFDEVITELASEGVIVVKDELTAFNTRKSTTIDEERKMLDDALRLFQANYRVAGEVIKHAAVLTANKCKLGNVILNRVLQIPLARLPDGEEHYVVTVKGDRALIANTILLGASLTSDPGGGELSSVERRASEIIGVPVRFVEADGASVSDGAVTINVQPGDNNVFIKLGDIVIAPPGSRVDIVGSGRFDVLVNIRDFIVFEMRKYNNSKLVDMFNIINVYSADKNNLCNVVTRGVKRLVQDENMREMLNTAICEGYLHHSIKRTIKALQLLLDLFRPRRAEQDG